MSTPIVFAPSNSRSRRDSLFDVGGNDDMSKLLGLALSQRKSTLPPREVDGLRKMLGGTSLGGTGLSVRLLRCQPNKDLNRPKRRAPLAAVLPDVVRPSTSSVRTDADPTSCRRTATAAHAHTAAESWTQSTRVAGTSGATRLSPLSREHRLLQLRTSGARQSPASSQPTSAHSSSSPSMASLTRLSLTTCRGPSCPFLLLPISASDSPRH